MKLLLLLLIPGFLCALATVVRGQEKCSTNGVRCLNDKQFVFCATLLNGNAWYVGEVKTCPWKSSCSQTTLYPCAASPATDPPVTESTVKEPSTTPTAVPTTPTPAPTTPTPAPTTPTPAPTTPTPAPTTPTPAPTTPTPAPTTTTQAPTTTTQAPTTTTQAPTTTTLAPTTATGVPPTTTPAAPTTSEAPPTTTTAVPTTAKVPDTTTEGATTGKGAPTTTARAPATTEAPAATTLAPGHTATPPVEITTVIAILPPVCSQTGVGKFRGPECNQYYECVNNWVFWTKVTLKTCPAGQAFDWVTAKACVAIETTTCVVASTAVTGTTKKA